MNKLDHFVKNNKELTLIILTWLTLIFYWCLKIFCGYYIEFAYTNTRFKLVCDFIDNNLIVNFLLSGALCYVMLYYYYAALLRKKKLSGIEKIILLVEVIVTGALSYIPNMIVLILNDVIKLIIIPLVLFKKINLKVILQVFMALGLNLLFQVISALIRNLSISNLQESSFICLLLSLDVIIMIFLFYEYRTKKGVEKNELITR